MHSVRLIAITQPLIEGVNTADELIAYAARVSNPSNQLNNETAPKLIKYCAKNKHWSIFETVNVVAEIKTTRDIGRQILRHRSFSFQEFSQRYADPTQDLGFALREARLQDNKNRQNSIEIEDEALDNEWKCKQIEIKNAALNAYGWAIKNGIAKEQARAILPEGLTLSCMYMNGTLRSWITYCQLRMKPGTQKEHRMIATDIWNLIIEKFPSLSELEFDQ
jgi:thymidylate synthase (FAD)